MTTQTAFLPTVSVKTASEHRATQTNIITRVFTTVSSLDRLGMALLRVGLVIVLLWIGGLKFASYEADSIVPLVANSPIISFLYHHPAPEYSHYVNKEGTETGQSRVAPDQRNLSGLLWPRRGHCVDWHSHRHVSD